MSEETNQLTLEQKKAAAGAVLLANLGIRKEAETVFPDLRKISAMAGAAAACWSLVVGINPPASVPDMESVIEELQEAEIFDLFKESFSKMLPE